jgi:hypothetical protein
MAYGDYNKRRVSGRPPNSGRGLGVRSKEIVKKIKNASIKNQIRSIQRLLRKVFVFKPYGKNGLKSFAVLIQLKKK